MACTPPSTRSIGYVFLDYRTNGFAIPHRTRLRLTHPHDPNDIATIRPAADQWGDLLAAILPPSSVVNGWGTMRGDGAVFFLEAFSPAKIGTHSVATGAAALRSRTLTLTGKGFPLSGLECAGQTRTVMYVTDAFEWAAGTTGIGTGTDADVEALRDFLTGNSILGGDFYGNVGNWRSTAPVQYNAYTQRRLGT